MSLFARSSRRLRVALAWLSLAAAGQLAFGDLAHLHEHGAAHADPEHSHLVTVAADADGCAERHLHALAEIREQSCSTCALGHGKTSFVSPTLLAGFVLPSLAPAACPAPRADRRALAPLPARGPPTA